VDLPANIHIFTYVIFLSKCTAKLAEVLICKILVHFKIAKLQLKTMHQQNVTQLKEFFLYINLFVIQNKHYNVTL